MAYFNNILTRYKVNETDTNNQSYSIDNDNIATLVGENSALAFISGSGNNGINVNGSVLWDGTIDSTATDLVAFDRHIVFTAASSRFTGTASLSGSHGYFVNCVFTFNGESDADPSDASNRVALLNGRGGDWNAQRADDIPSDRTGRSCFHFYNCTFIFAAGGNFTGSFVTGDMYDCKFLVANPDFGEFHVHPLGGSVQDNTEASASVVLDRSNDTAVGNFSGNLYQIASSSSTFDNLSMENMYFYSLGNFTYTLPFLSVDQNILYTSSGSGTPANPPKIRQGEFNNFTTVSWLPSPKTDVQKNGEIFWRNARNLGDDSGLTRVIGGIRFDRTVYSDVNQSTPRSQVKYNFTTNVEYTTAGSAHTISQASNNVVRTYITDTTGVMQGNYLFSDGTTTPVDSSHQFLDIPITAFRADTGKANNDFSTLRTDFTTSLDVISFFGQTSVSSDLLNSSLWADNQTEADGRDGFWLPYDIERTVDLTDEYMVNYANQSDVSNISSNGFATISANDVYAVYKLAVWNQDNTATDTSKSNVDFNYMISVDDFPYSAVSNGVFDMSTLGVHDLTISNDSDYQPYGVLSAKGADDFDELAIRCAGLAAKDEDVITGLKVANLGMGNNAIEIDVEANLIHTFRQYAESSNAHLTPDTTFSAKDVTLGGILNVREDSPGPVAVFHNVSWMSGTTVQRTPTDTEDVTVYLTGTTENDNNVTFTNIANLFTVAEFTVNFQRVLTASDISMALYESTDGSSFNLLSNPTVTVASDGLSATFTVTIDASSGNQIYYAILAEGHEMVSGATSSDIELDLDMISIGALNPDADVSGTDDAALQTSVLSMEPPASNTDTFTVSATFAVSNTDSTTQGARLFVRRIEKLTGWLQSVARGYIPSDYFTYMPDTIVISNQTQANRITIEKAASNSAIVRLNTRIVTLEPSPADLYQSLSSSFIETYIEFSQDQNGAGAAEIQGLLDALEESIKGSGNRDLTEIQNRTKLIPALLTKL